MERPHDDLAQVASSTNSSGSTASAMRSSTGSWPAGVIVIVLPAAKGPESSIRSMSAIQSGQPATSDHRRQIASGGAVVSMLCSLVHMWLLRSRLPARDDGCHRRTRARRVRRRGSREPWPRLAWEAFRSM
jgi:hypothetical protein